MLPDSKGLYVFLQVLACVQIIFMCKTVFVLLGLSENYSVQTVSNKNLLNERGELL